MNGKNEHFRESKVKWTSLALSSSTFLYRALLHWPSLLEYKRNTTHADKTSSAISLNRLCLNALTHLFANDPLDFLNERQLRDKQVNKYQLLNLRLSGLSSEILLTGRKGKWVFSYETFSVKEMQLQMQLNLYI